MQVMKLRTYQPAFNDQAWELYLTRQKIKELQAKEKELVAYFKTQSKCGNAPGFVMQDEELTVTKSTSFRTNFDSVKFKAECPDLYAKYKSKQVKVESIKVTINE